MKRNPASPAGMSGKLERRRSCAPRRLVGTREEKGSRVGGGGELSIQSCQRMDGRTLPAVTLGPPRDLSRPRGNNAPSKNERAKVQRFREGFRVLRPEWDRANWVARLCRLTAARLISLTRE